MKQLYWRVFLLRHICHFFFPSPTMILSATLDDNKISVNIEITLTFLPERSFSVSALESRDQRTSGFEQRVRDTNFETDFVTLQINRFDLERVLRDNMSLRANIMIYLSILPWLCIWLSWWKKTRLFVYQKSSLRALTCWISDSERTLTIWDSEGLRNGLVNYASLWL